MISRSNIILYGGIAGLMCITFMWCNPSPVRNKAHTFKYANERDMFDTARQIKRIYIDSLLPLLQAAGAQVQLSNQGCVAEVTATEKLQISVPKGCESSFNRIFTGDIDLQAYFKMKNGPMKPIESARYGFECELVTTSKGRIVRLPVDILKSVVEHAHGGAAVATTRVASPRVAKPKVASTQVAKPKKKK